MDFENGWGKMKSKIILISYPVHKAFITPIKNLSTILGGFSEDGEVLITSNENSWEQVLSENINHYHIISKNYQNIFLRVFNYILTEIRITYLLFKISKSEDIVIYFMHSSPILPLFLSKLMKMKIIRMLPSSVKISLWDSRTDFLSFFPVLVQKIGYSISDNIIVYSPLLIRDWNLEKYKRKIKIARHHFIDFDIFRMTLQLSKRPNMIGYIGRMNFEKGFENFLDALPTILDSDRNLKILIVGDGPLKHLIPNKLTKDQLENNIIVKNWSFHEDLPEIYNKLKLLIIPSYTEGLSNVLIEAMACGTPVLVTPVGANLDIIKDSETGYIMENNSSDCIEKNVNRALKDPNLEKIALSAKLMVEREFTFDITIKLWKRILDKI
jgi:glycosyltransferase involved in cell wall biosynthesis